MFSFPIPLFLQFQVEGKCPKIFLIKLSVLLFGIYLYLKILCRTIYESSYLDIGEGIAYRIPPAYEKLAVTLNLPTFSDIRVEEYYLKSTLDLGSLAEMMTADKRFGPKSRAGMGEPQSQYESLQARLRALSSSNSVQKFSLKVSDIALNSSSIPEGAAGSIQRSILSEGGALQVYYVKVLEKGDTYEVSVAILMTMGSF